MLPGLAPHRLGFAPERVGLAPQRLRFAAERLGLAPERFGFEVTEVILFQKDWALFQKLKALPLL